MARKKKTGGKEEKDNGNDKSKPVKKATDHSQISELVFNHAPTNEHGVTGASTRWSLNSIRGKLRTRYSGWEEIEQAMKDQAQAAIASADNNGTGADWENAEDRLRHEMDRQKNDRYTANDRRTQHFDRRDNEARHEDFLYYQNITNRNARSRMLDPIKRQAAEKERQGRRHAYKLELCLGQDYDHFDWLHDLLEYYDNRGIADSDYRKGRTDRLSNWIPEKERRYPPVLGPGDLHLWTPRRRRVACGLRPRNNDPYDEAGDAEIDEDGKFDDEAPTVPPIDRSGEAVDDHGLYLNSKGDQELGPLVFELDNAAIEQERNRIDSKAKHADDDAVVEATHNARRLREKGKYAGTRPNTSNIRIRRGQEGEGITEDRWREIQTAAGLFIAAKETSWDWLTSYDCLDRVDQNEMPGIIATSAVRETADLDDDYDLVHEMTDPTESDAAAPPARAAAPKAAKSKRKGKKRKNRSDDDSTTTNRPNKKRKTGNDNAQKIEYPYQRSEFWQRK